MGFTLTIANAPPEAVWFIGDFAENTFNYEPPAASEALEIDQAWDYPSDPLGCTTLHIMLFDVEHTRLLDVYNLGPVNDGMGYVYDCSTGELYEVGIVLPLGPILIGGLALFGIGVAMVLAGLYQRGRRPILPKREKHHSIIVPAVAAATALRLEEERRKKEKEKPRGLRW